MRDMFTEVDIEGRRYQLGVMTPEIGSWIANVLLTCTMKAQSEQRQTAAASSGADNGQSENTPEFVRGLIGAMWLMASQGLSPETYQRIQRECLSLCKAYVAPNAPPVPVRMTDGRYLPELNDLTGISTVNRLVTETLQFNLTPFFSAPAQASGGTAA